MISKIEEVNFYKQNIRFVDDLNLEELKTRYGWILNASIKNAIIGQTPDKTLIWYSGVWNDGVWKNGIWCSGMWENGEWRNGEWFSYDFSTYDLINYIKSDSEKNMSMLDIINKKLDIESSYFKKGVWKNGFFNFGRLGIETTYDVNEFIYNTREPSNDRTLVDVIWEDGIFINGSVVNTLWNNGVFKKGYFLNSIWDNGEYYSGLFYNSIWNDGSWYGGDFMKGVWFDGVFSHTNKQTVCRFGFTDKIDSKYVQCVWKNGHFYSGEWFNGYKISKENYIFSDNNDVAVWYNGVFHNGVWYGGMFLDGEWVDGTWHNGIFGNYSSIFYNPDKVDGENWGIDSDFKSTFETDMKTEGTISGDNKYLVTDSLILDNFKIDPVYISAHASKITNIEIVINQDGFYNTASNLNSSSMLNNIYSRDNYIDLIIRTADELGSNKIYNLVTGSTITEGITYNGEVTEEGKGTDWIGKAKDNTYMITLRDDDIINDVKNIRIDYKAVLNMPKSLAGQFQEKVNINYIQIKFYFKTDQIGFTDEDDTDEKVLERIEELRFETDNKTRTPIWHDGTWYDGTAVNATIYQTKSAIGYAINCNFTKTHK